MIYLEMFVIGLAVVLALAWLVCVLFGGELEGML